MKKVLIGVGIGCGVILLLGIGVMVAGGMFLKNKFGGTLEAGPSPDGGWTVSAVLPRGIPPT